MNSSKNLRVSPASTPGITEIEPVMKEKPASTDNATAPPAKVVADQDHPPLFLHPLETRETYVTSWDYAVPFVTSYVDSHPTPTFRFRHRPRIGRGGRVVIDRLPRPGNPDLPPVNVFTTGDEVKLHGTDNPHTRLLDLLPEPLNHEKLSRRIEEIAASALSDDEENVNQTRSVIPVVGNNANVADKENDGEEVLVKVSDWMETDEQLWGEELCAIGPV
jgi:enhancer of polycomb-like protein